MNIQLISPRARSKVFQDTLRTPMTLPVAARLASGIALHRELNLVGFT